MQAFADAFHDEIKRRQTNNASNKSAVQKDLLKVETGIKRCVDLLLHSDTPMESIRSTLEELETQKRALVRESALQTQEDKIVLHPNIGALYARKVSNLKSLLENDATKHQATEIIRSLIETIAVAPTGQRGKRAMWFCTGHWRAYSHTQASPQQGVRYHPMLVGFCWLREHTTHDVANPLNEIKSVKQNGKGELIISQS